MRRLMGACVVLAAALVAAPGAAQDRASARRVFDEATRQFDSGNFSLALENFQQARSMLDGDARAQTLILFNIARAQEELQQYREALQSYQQYLDQAPSDAPFREQTLDRVRELRIRVGRRGGDAGGGSPLVVVGGIVAGIGALTAIAAIPTGILALDDRARLDRECPDGRCPQSAQALLDQAYTLGLMTDVLWITGVGLAAIGAALLAVGLATSQDTPQVGALCTGDGCAATLALRF